MNELSLLNDMLEGRSMDAPLRGLLRPWHLEADDGAPRIRVDVSEADGRYAVKAEIPGVRKEDIDVRIDGNVLTISAEVKQEKEQKKGERVLRSERRYGYASRSFTLADAVDESRTEAHYDNGVLTLTLPKRAQSERKRIAVS